MLTSEDVRACIRGQNSGSLKQERRRDDRRSQAGLRGLGNLVLACLLLYLHLFELESLLGNADELLAGELLELSDGILIDRVDEEKGVEAFLLENLEEG